MIRPAVPQDAEAIDRILVRAWEHAFADFIPPEQMRGSEPPEERVQRWRERMDHPEIRTWVWDQEGVVAGFASAGRQEIRALYVDPAAQGAGVGSALLAHAEAALRAEGAEAATLWVFSANGHGRRFYEAHGWQLVEGTESELDGVAPGVGYRKPL